MISLLWNRFTRFIERNRRNRRIWTWDRSVL